VIVSVIKFYVALLMQIDSLNISPVSKYPTVHCHGVICLRGLLLQKILGKGVNISEK
jgi:hypothetical protein